MKRRTLLQGLTLAALMPATLVQAQGSLTVQVYRHPGCGCCGAWMDHLRANGFTVQEHQVNDTGVYRERFKIGEQFASCHTATVGGYALEGHVPAREIRRILKEKPHAIGLAVPGMPMGSPGMEGAYSEAYDVLLIDASGRARPYAHYPALNST